MRMQGATLAYAKRPPVTGAHGELDPGTGERP